jgi:hypothetical protein
MVKFADQNSRFNLFQSDFVLEVPLGFQISILSLRHQVDSKDSRSQNFSFLALKAEVVDAVQIYLLNHVIYS